METTRLRGSVTRHLALLLGPSFIVLTAVGFWFAIQSDPHRPLYVDFPAEILRPGEPLFFTPLDMGSSVDHEPYGIWLVRQGEGQFAALYSRSPHPVNECHVRFDRLADGANAVFHDGPDGSFVCPGSLFNDDGLLLLGPGPRNMDRFDTMLRGDLLRIDISRLRLGECSSQVEYIDGCVYSTASRPVYRTAVIAEGVARFP